MSKALLQILTLGMGATNCYLLKNKETGEALIIDPPGEAVKIEAALTEMAASPVAVLLTHGHYDHIIAVDEIREFYHIPVYAHESEKVVLEDESYNLSKFFSKSVTVTADYYFTGDETLTLAGFEIQIMHTPGHTVGSVCFYLEDEKILLSGDTLFENSYGRTDFPTSNPGQMKRSIKKLLSELPSDVMVYPGHGESTSIEAEKRYNPLA